MSKYEFLEQLKDYLAGQIPDSAIRDHIDYYRSYIENEVRNGRPEADVIFELGDPRLLGKTIIDAKAAKTAYNSGNTSYNSDSGTPKAHNLLRKIKIILIIALVLAILFFIVRFAVRLLIYILPVIIILTAIVAISHFWKRR